MEQCESGKTGDNSMHNASATGQNVINDSLLWYIAMFCNFDMHYNENSPYNVL